MPAPIALPLLIALCAPPVSPRWDAPAKPGPEAAAVDAARAALRPLYTLRGLLFLLRAEAAGVDAGVKGLTPADVGLFATRLTRPRNDLSRGPGLKQVVAAAWDAAPDAATARAMKATYRRLAEDPRMKAGADVKAAALDEAARDRVSSLATLVRDAVDDLEAAKAGPAAAGKALAPVAKKLAAGTTAAALRTPAGLAGLDTPADAPLARLRPLADDTTAADDVRAAIVAELNALAPVVKSGWRKASAAPDLARLAERLPPEGFAAPIATALSSQVLPRAPVPLDPDAVCRTLWDASCARLTTCHGAIANVVMSPVVCEEGADALIQTCIDRSPAGYADKGVTHAALKACLDAWEKRPCEQVCGKSAPLPPECARFAPGLEPVEVQCGAPGKLFDEEDPEGGVE